MNFTYRSLPWNIVFGAGSVSHLPDELHKAGFSRALVLTTPEQRDQGEWLSNLLGDRAVGLFDQARMHVPVDTVHAAWKEARSARADCTVAFGGGSTTGLGKALMLEHDLPNVAVPTSYAGSEMTNIWGTTQDRKKRTGRSDAVVPKLTVYDPELTISLPVAFSAASGLNAMAQAAVNVATNSLNPIVALMAAEAVRALHEGLPSVVKAPDDIHARSLALYGACLAGASLGTGTTGLHHRLCHTLGGTLNTPHAQTHTVLLPHSIAFNAVAAASGTRRLAAALSTDNAAVELYEFAKRLSAPTSLQQIGVEEADLDEAARVATETPVANPEPVSTDRVRWLLDNAYNGRTPEIPPP
ncbi:MAG: maleylacetate reductase [Pseudomonadota bacterium]